MPVTKEFKTIDEQISGLLGRGLKFKNRKKAAKVLSQYNYFDVINGFESILLKKNVPNKEYENVYFEDFRDLFFFDMKLKNIRYLKYLMWRPDCEHQYHIILRLHIVKHLRTL